VLQRLQHLNRLARTWLWVLVAIGVIAALPLGLARYHMEKTSKEVEYVFNYRDLAQIANYQARPNSFIDEQLDNLKAAGITTLAVFETTLDDLAMSRSITLYDSAQVAWVAGKPAPPNENFTYLLFADPAAESELRPMIEQAFRGAGVSFSDWAFGGRSGIVLETPVADAVSKSMPPDPLALKAIKAHGMQIIPRLSDRMQPYNAEQMDKLMGQFAELGVKRLLFDGDLVTGFTDNEKTNSLVHFAGLLNKYDIGITVIENTKKPQSGINKLAFLTNYNVVRLYSLNAGDAAGMSPEAIADRFLLAAKDRNIRMFYMNGQPVKSINDGAITNPLDNVYEAIGGGEDTEGAIAKLSSFGFPSGTAEPLHYEHASWQKPLKAIVVVGAIAFIALLIGAFLPIALLPAFILGLLGSAGLYVLSTSMLEQGLALGAAIAAPTLALIWVIGRIRTHTEGDRRTVGGDWTAAPDNRSDRLFGGQWIFQGLTSGRRLGMALGWFALTSVISLMGVPFVFGLLNNITYSLVLQQFRGVSLLHLAPIALVALYVFIYTGQSVMGNIRKLLRMQITVLWVVAAVVLGAAGLYYLSRTGNTGQAPGIELVFRNALEQTFGVRPRSKEFMLAHPLFLLGLFLSLRYRAAWVLMIVASIGQLSMVDTFAHIHTPIHISLIRDLLGLGLGAIIGLVLIAVWQLAEGAWKWAARLKTKSSVS
jgi:hypothetical protein